MPMTCTKQKEVLGTMLEMYRNMPYLWQKDHDDYMNKKMREEGFKILVKIYKRFDETADVKLVKKKIENMRTNYAKEYKKVLASKRSGAEDNEVYQPSLWYYEALSFLGSNTDPNITVNVPIDNFNSSSHDETGSLDNNSINFEQIKKEQDFLLQEQEHIFLSEQKANTVQKDEEWEVYGRAIGLQMRGLNKRQLFISQKIISDVLFYAKFDKLTEDSYVVVGSSSECKPNSSRSHQVCSTSPSST